MSRPRRTLRNACLTGLAAVSALSLGVTTATAAGSPTPADRTIASKLNVRFPAEHLGSHASGQVMDVAAGRVVWSRNASATLMPASTAKLATAIAALTVLGTRHTEQTRALLYGGSLYLVGGGDQHLTSSDLNALAAATAAALKANHVTSVTLHVDDSLFPAPTLSPGWPADYYPGEVAPVRALALLGDRVMDTSLHAGSVFAYQLGTHGIRASGPSHGTAPRSSKFLAARTSASLAYEIDYMLKESDNDNAEGFARLTALAQGRSADWRGATAAVRSALTRYGVPQSGVVLYDGSGLSRSDRMTAPALATLAGLAVDSRYHSVLWPVLPGLPVAGVDGTLGPAYGRFTTWPSDCARGKVMAKTGTLHDAVALAGVTLGADGRWKSFAFVENGAPDLSSARLGVDALAATVEGCW
ncbi:D-alanyl-D-alanine carboxypeptidase/D-alanyl-D-alanine-endopeptidase (penicillin-binding protein 4) [Streptacidiphilus sp. MAP12-20]|uniref:D-alanyl-D-alanine carboxypeptidase/D-alanyl-D-alanine endopeptidase n=1 Tax=Streptacidiphilus sp. MAP12-20 TaxID=3156299 RepID=UPI003515CD73